MNNPNEEIVNGANPSIIWTQYMDFLSEFGRQMKSTYTKRMRANQPITWSELDAMNKQIHNKLDYLMTWSEKFNQNGNTPQQQNNTQVQPTTESVRRNTNKIRLSESQLHRVIKESVKKVLKENYGSLGTYYEQLKSYLLHRKDCVQQHHQNGVDTFQIKEDLVLHGRKCNYVCFCVDNTKDEEYISVGGYGIIQDDKTCALVLYALKNHEAIEKDGYSSYTL